MGLFLDLMWSVRKSQGMVPKHWPEEMEGDHSGGMGREQEMGRGALQDELMRNSAGDMPPPEVQPGLR